MREIKFRVWEKESRKFVSGYEAFDYVCGWQNDETGSHIILRQERYEIMQYTGLKDKNGKEIYEGDIVQVEGAIPAEIYWDYCSWQLRNGDQTGGMLGNWEADQIEVIGNTYENPDLLSRS